MTATFSALAERLRNTRVACGEWDRVLGDSVTWRHGTTAVLLDPPYSDGADDLYGDHDKTLSAKVREWCAENGHNRELRIALCGYSGEGHEVLEARGWSVESWKAKGGYGSQRQDGTNDNAKRERIWFSPGCIDANAGPLFARIGGAA